MTVDAAWVAQTADRVLAAMEEHRSTWQMWHVRAEAQRWIRTTDVRTESTDALVDLLVDEVLHSRSVPLAAPDDGIQEPEVLRRVDGSSVYTVAGADLYTSQRILDAEQRLITTAGRYDGAVVDESAVDLALLEMAANRTTLDAGQVALARSVHLGCPVAVGDRAGRGREDHRHARPHLGLDPGRRPGHRTRPVGGRGRRPWRTDRYLHRHTGEAHLVTAARSAPGLGGPDRTATLVIIDEAGMADTLTLDRVVQFVVARGGSVRLIGDDQQLAAIGAGGILRDITHTHGALQLTWLHRFTHPAEAAASLALRDGDPTALEFYLNHGRVHVGDPDTTTQDAFTAWAGDRTAGEDAIMLAPTRDLVADLDHRARTHRLGGTPAGREVQLADGNLASVGDVIITRSNDRRLRVSASDWVKNGDRWTITHIGRRGDLVCPA